MTALSRTVVEPYESTMVPVLMEALRLCPSPGTMPFPTPCPFPAPVSTFSPHRSSSFKESPLLKSVGLAHEHTVLGVGPDKDSVHDRTSGRLF